MKIKNISLETLNKSYIKTLLPKVFTQYLRFTKNTLDFDPSFVKVLSTSPKSQVYLIDCPMSKLVLKKFVNQEDFLNELKAYLFLRGGPIPNLLGSDANQKILFIEYISGLTFNINNPNHNIEDVVELLAFAHNTMQDNFNTLTSNDSLGKFEFPIARPYYEIMGNHNIPMSIGDIKYDHVIYANSCKVIDLETFQIGVPEWRDIAQLKLLFDSEKDFEESLLNILRIYLINRHIFFDESILCELKQVIANEWI